MSGSKTSLILTANSDSDWTYYLEGHDVAELVQVDDPAVLKWQPLYMRPIPASALEDEGIFDEWSGPGPYWIECESGHPSALPFLGVRYR